MSWESLDNIPNYPEENKGFEIKCLNCGSNNCIVNQTGYYDYGEFRGLGNLKITCTNCGQEVDN